MKYVIRQSVLEKETSYELKEKSVCVATADNKTQHIPYSEIKYIRLIHDPTRLKTDRYSCIIKHRFGKLTISNAYFKGFANFKDMSAEYNGFVLALHQKLKEYPKIDFYSGLTKTAYRLYVFLGLFSLLVVSGLIIFFSNFISGLLFIKVILIGFYTVIMVSYLKKNKPQKYMPNQIPEKIIPKGLDTINN